MKIDPYSQPGLRDVEDHLLKRFNAGFSLRTNDISSFDEYDENSKSHVQGWNSLARSEQMAIRLLVTIHKMSVAERLGEVHISSDIKISEAGAHREVTPDMLEDILLPEPDYPPREFRDIAPKPGGVPPVEPPPKPSDAFQSVRSPERNKSS